MTKCLTNGLKTTKRQDAALLFNKGMSRFITLGPMDFSLGNRHGMLLERCLAAN